MDNVIGKRVFTTFRCFKIGTIVEHNTELDFFIVMFDDGSKRSLTRFDVHFNKQSAINACCDLQDYWETQIEKIELIDEL